MAQLMDILEKYLVGDQELEDDMIWVHDEDGGFSVPSMSDALTPQRPEFSPGICVWNPHIQLKVSFFMWKLWWNRAPLVTTLSVKGCGLQIGVVNAF